MKIVKWISLFAALTLVAACFMQWIVVDSRGIVVSGVNAQGTSFGKPGYMHLLLTGIYLIFLLIPKIWAKRWNLAVVAINLGWAIRNYFLITVCRGGECPSKKAGMYLVMLSSVVMLIGALFPDVKMEEEPVEAV